MKRVYIIVLFFLSSMLMFAQRTQGGLYLISDRDLRSNIGYSTRVAPGTLFGIGSYSAPTLGGTITPAAVWSGAAPAPAQTFVSADEVLQTASVPVVIHRASPPPGSVNPNEAIGPITDAVWLLLLLAATYALLLHKRRKTV